ncbi:4126_t:CDS:2, partial [Diversispora eburnea]
IAGGMIISDEILQEKEREFATHFNIEESQLNFFKGWLTKFKKRNNIHMYKLHGEVESAPLESLAEEYLKLQELLSKCNPEDDKTKVTVLLATNITETHKLKPLVIGHNKNPQYFKNINVTSLPVLLLVDNAPSHTSPVENNSKKNKQQSKDNVSFTLTNITIHYLPPNTTSHIQPLDAGIIKKNATYQKLITEIETYINAIDKLLATEDVLSESEIVTMILADNEIENNTSPDPEEEEELPPPRITSTDALNALKTLIRYEEQLSDNETISQDELRKRLPLYEKM